MLSQKTIATIKSTIPVLREGGEALTQHFYKRMFRVNPEVAPLFNEAHQQSNSQQNALALAICAYAENIDNLQALGSAVELITHKHASLNILPEHYPIVGENLLASIQEVLGEAASTEVIGAWAEAYQFLADLLVAKEEEIYQSQEQKVGGWRGFKEFKVIKKEVESSEITSLYFSPVGQVKLPGYSPGQFITVKVPTVDGSTTMRNYSLSEKPGNNHYRISVKREVSPDGATPDGFVSSLLHDKISLGDKVSIAGPCGQFVLDKLELNQPLVFLAGGVGITPILSMIQQALTDNPDRYIKLLHAVRNSKVQAFKTTLEELQASHANFHISYLYSEEKAGQESNGNAMSGFISSKVIQQLKVNPDLDSFYFCGPKEFMIATYRELSSMGVQLSQMHYEFFGPQEVLTAS